MSKSKLPATHAAKSLGLACAALVASACFIGLLSRSIRGEDSEHLLTIDHYVRVRSTVPAIAGQSAQIYVRERANASTVLRGASFTDRVVLFVHGGGSPSEVAFDVPYQDYSWMAYLARARFDVFAMDFTGFGRSTRPLVMNDPCNLPKDQQSSFIPGLLPALCMPSYPYELTTIASDWDDLDAVVDYIRALRHVDRVSLIGWSLGGPRAGGYALRHPEKVQKLVLLAPVSRTTPSSSPAKLPVEGVPMTEQSRDDFMANWERQVGCQEQYDPAVKDIIWLKMLESDPIGATWERGVRRAPVTTLWGWNSEVFAKLKISTLTISGAHDKQVLPELVRKFYADLGSRQKVFIDLGCSSHNAMWEKNHTMLFRASLEWLTLGSVNGTNEGILRLGY